MIGIAVLGAGNWGRNLVRDFAARKNCELRYVCDLNPKTLTHMSAAYPKVRVISEAEIALNDPAVHGVVVAVDVPGHFALAKAALLAGKHVFVEKPLTLASKDSAELIQLAHAGKRILMVGHLLEYHPAVRHIKRMITEGEIDPVYLYFQRVNLGVVRRKENAWWSLACHDISVACYLLGAEPVSVSASGQSTLQRGVEDVVFASLKFADDRISHIHVSWLDPHKIRKMTVVGTKKMVVFDDMEAAEKIRIYDKGADLKTGVDSYVEAITLRNGDIWIPRIPMDEPLGLECAHFLECITENRQPLSDGLDGLRVVRVLEAGSVSLASGGAPARVAGASDATLPSVPEKE